MGKVELRLGKADVLDGLCRGDGDEQRGRVGETDVLAGQDHDPAGDEPGVLTGLEHARQPVVAASGSEPRIDLMKALMTS